MKILYAADNRLGSYYQLGRFLESIASKNYDIKIAGYKTSLKNLNADYTLDSLLNFGKSNDNISFNGNYKYYNNEIKRFNPDLIISDFEIYTSIIALDLKIKLWQFSPINIYYGLDSITKQDIGIYQHYPHLINPNHKRAEYIANILDGSNKKLVPSHLCDNISKPSLIKGFDYVRPSFILGTAERTCDTIIALATSNKNVIDKNKSSAILSSFQYESLRGRIIITEKAYQDMIGDCSTFISDGTATFLADAFYNQKYCISYPRYDDIESVICSYVNEFYGVGKTGVIDDQQISINIDNDIKFLSEHLDQL